MQHPDEGTIHSWLDGALSADEAARVEAHVKDCPECAAAVAEARGFIAASSRILTALDNAPRGVIPVAAPRKRIDPIVWRIAATLLVVAGGTFVVLRNGGREAPTSVVTRSDKESTAVIVDAAQASGSNGAVAPSASDEVEATRKAAKAPAPTKSPGNTPRAVVGSSPENVFSGRATAKVGSAGMSTANGNSAAVATPPVYSAPAAPPSQANRTQALSGRLMPRSDNSVEGRAPALQSLAPAPAPAAAGSVAALDAMSEALALKKVGTARQIGANTTLYEVAPGDTVTLTEIVSAQLESVVVTGLSATPRTDQSTGKSAPAQATKSGVAGVTTISWTDPVTRNAMKLSGRMSPERLQQIKTQIERERAAEAAKKKP